MTHPDGFSSLTALQPHVVAVLSARGGFTKWGNMLSHITFHLVRRHGSDAAVAESIIIIIIMAIPSVAVFHVKPPTTIIARMSFPLLQ